MESSRLAAARTVIRITKDSAYSSIELSNNTTQFGDNANEKALYAAIVRTVIERKNTLDFIIGMFVRKKPDPTVTGLLYVGIVQLLYLSKIPDSAACDETVKAAKVLTDEKRSGFVNGVLRNICRSREKINAELQKADDCVKYSMDESILKLLKKQYPDEYETVASASFSRPPMCLRVNTLKTAAAELVNELAEKGVVCESDGSLINVKNGNEKVLPLLEDGKFYVQGRPSQFAVKLLGAKKGMIVIDVCACPGGKTVGAAIDMENEGRVIALDIHENKLSLIKKTASRLGIGIIETSVNDSRTVREELVCQADRVICDVPCSSLGVLSSKPEIRYKKTDDLKNLYETQYAILCASAEYLKKGGRMVYSTCTFNENENSAQVHRFIESKRDFTLVEEHRFITDNGCFDGFYAALIERKNND